MASNYPGGLDSFDTIDPDDRMSDAVGGLSHLDMHNGVNDAVEAVQAELGTDPSGSAATVAARLDGIEAGTRLLPGSVTADQLAVDVGAATLDIGTVGTGPADVDITGNVADGYTLDFTLPPVGNDSIGTAAIQNGAVTAHKLDPATTGIYNVKAFGAVGDGVADDTAAIQAAIDAADPGDEVVLPAGSYKITAPIEITQSRVTVRGAGAHSSVVIAVDCGGISIDAANYVTLVGLEIASAVRYSDTPNSHVGIDIAGDTAHRPSGHVYRDVFVDGFHTAWRTCYLWSSTFDNVSCLYGLVGVAVYGLSVNNTIAQSALVVAQSTSSRGIVFAGQESPADATDVASEGWIITSSLIYGGGIGVHIRGNTHITVTSCIIDFCSVAGVRIEDNGTHFAGNSVVSDSYIAMTGADGVAAVHVNNAISNSQNYGNRIIGNHLITYAGGTCTYGVYIYDHPSTSLIAHNILDEFGTDIYLVAQKNQVIGNRCLSTPGATKNIFTTEVGNLVADNLGEVYLAGGDPRVYRVDACGRKEWTGLAAPTAGTHALGDRVVNAYPAVGEPTHWWCTVPGSPGTWVAGPDL